MNTTPPNISPRLVPRVADRLLSLNPSAIREIFKFIGAPGMISFAGGNPSEKTFPAAELSAISEELFREKSGAVLQYGLSEGYGPLRELTKTRLREKFSVGTDFDDIIIVSGGQQAIDLSLKTLTNEGDTVLCENPSFIGALNDIRSYNINLVGIQTDEHGMDVAALEKALETNKNVRLIYTIPTFQNPTGVTLSLKRRRRMYELAVKYNVVILEDDPYRELRYSGDDIPPIKSLDEAGRVIYCGSYSKTVAPGLRVGFAVMDKAIIPKYTVAKQCADVQTVNFSQMLIAEYLEKYDFDAHVEHCRNIYRAQRDLMISGLDENLSGLTNYPPGSANTSSGDCGVSFTRPDGGLFIWVSLPSDKSGQALFDRLIQKGLAAVPGGAFHPAGEDLPGIRLNFSMPAPEQIIKGAKIFGETLKEYI